MKLKALGVAAAIAAAFAIGAVPAVAVTGDGQLGGPPSTTFVADQTLCPEGEAVIGVSGFTRLIGVFIPIVAVATVQCSGGSPGTTMGSGSGNPGSTSCPPGQVAVGITGREGDFIDLLQLRCQNADGSGSITNSTGFGGGLGGPDGPYDCPAGMVLTGLKGQSVPGTILGGPDSTIRYVEIVCVANPENGGNGDNGNGGNGGNGDNGGNAGSGGNGGNRGTGGSGDNAGSGGNGNGNGGGD